MMPTVRSQLARSVAHQLCAPDVILALCRARSSSAPRPRRPRSCARARRARWSPGPGWRRFSCCCCIAVEPGSLLHRARAAREFRPRAVSCPRETRGTRRRRWKCSRSCPRRRTWRSPRRFLPRRRSKTRTRRRSPARWRACRRRTDRTRTRRPGRSRRWCRPASAARRELRRGLRADIENQIVGGDLRRRLWSSPVRVADNSFATDNVDRQRHVAALAL